VIQGVTFRLADALPHHVVEAWKETDLGEGELRSRIAAYLDAGHGSCVLKQSIAAEAVEDVLLHGHDEQYRLLAWVVMPNHVHLVVQMKDGTPLGEVVRRWKGISARRINGALARSGRLWQPGFFDRYVRDENHLLRVVAYVHENPVRASLVRRPEDWPYSSASRAWGQQ